MQSNRNHTGYKVISENPTTVKGFMNNPAKVAKISLTQVLKGIRPECDY
jgi:hypothetical protein